MAAASRAKRLLGDRGEVVVFERTRWVSFALCGTPYYIGRHIDSLDELIYYTPKFFKEKRGINIKLNTIVEEIDAQNSRLLYKEEDRRTWYEYDRLILATGAQPKLPKPWKQYLSYGNFFTLRSLNDAERIRNYISRDDIREVAIIGAGYIGYEVAENLQILGKEVTIIEMMPQVLPVMLDPDMAVEAAKPTGGCQPDWSVWGGILLRFYGHR
jgi:NADPH-dependent 2,4-dienoyl-CoA reductase/sulfur reductase-like enzyme